MIIGHYNINSFRYKFNQIRHILDHGLCSIMGFSETKLDQSFTNGQFLVEGYKMYRQDRNEKGGGILIYINESIPHRLLPEKCGSNEGIDYMSIEITTHLGKCNMIYLYRPPRVHEKVLDLQHF